MRGSLAASGSRGASRAALPGEPSMAGATATCGFSPESVGGAALDGLGGASDGTRGSAGEADGAAEAGDDGEPPACAIAHPGGVVDHQLMSGGREREYRLFVPDSYDGRTRSPLMFNLHGTGGDAAGQAQDSGMERLAPRGRLHRDRPPGFQNNWNVLMNDPRAVDDVQYTNDVLNDARRKACVDERKVYATGFLAALACRRAWLAISVDATREMWALLKNHALPFGLDLARST
jgi:hypothetical protein